MPAAAQITFGPQSWRVRLRGRMGHGGQAYVPVNTWLRLPSDLAQARRPAAAVIAVMVGGLLDPVHECRGVQALRIIRSPLLIGAGKCYYAVGRANAGNQPACHTGG